MSQNGNEFCLKRFIFKTFVCLNTISPSISPAKVHHMSSNQITIITGRDFLWRLSQLNHGSAWSLYFQPWHRAYHVRLSCSLRLTLPLILHINCHNKTCFPGKKNPFLDKILTRRLTHHSSPFRTIPTFAFIFSSRACRIDCTYLPTYLMMDNHNRKELSLLTCFDHDGEKRNTWSRSSSTL